MKFIIHGNKIQVTDAIKTYIESKVGKLDKYFESPEDITATVSIRTRGIDQIVEVTIPIKKMILRCQENNKDLYAAIDIASDKLERQIRKNKTKLKHKKDTNTDIFVDFEIIEGEEEKPEKIVKRKSIENKPMSEEEAILQMNLLGHEFFIFYNTDTDNMSVLYKRKEDGYGIIEIH